MKKVLFTLLGMGVLSLSAQLVNNKNNYNPEKLKIVVKNDTKGSTLKRDAASEWFDYVQAYDQAESNGLAAASFVSWIQPDTNLSNIGSTNTKSKIGFHVLGRVNDPRDPVFDNNPVKFSRYNSYKWDSIRFLQFYIRQVDSTTVGPNTVSVVDTLFIQYFLPAGLDNQSYFYNATPTVTHYYSCPNRNNYNKKTRLNSSAFRTDTILLTDKFGDSIDMVNSQVFGRRLTLPVGLNVVANQNNLNSCLTAHTITFKPMLPTILGDTGLAFNNAKVFRKHNMYGLSLCAQTGVEVDNTSKEAQNNSIITNFEVLYGQTVSIFKSYLPGNAFANTIFDNTEYHLTATQGVSVNRINTGNAIDVIYPNPAKENSEVLLTVNSVKDAAAVITVTDVTGKVIRTINASLVNGNNTITVSTDSLTKGMYLVNLIGEGYTTSSKLIIE